MNEPIAWKITIDNRGGKPPVVTCSFRLADGLVYYGDPHSLADATMDKIIKFARAKAEGRKEASDEAKEDQG